MKNCSGIFILLLALISVGPAALCQIPQGYGESTSLDIGVSGHKSLITGDAKLTGKAYLTARSASSPLKKIMMFYNESEKGSELVIIDEDRLNDDFEYKVPVAEVVNIYLMTTDSITSVTIVREKNRGFALINGKIISAFNERGVIPNLDGVDADYFKDKIAWQWTEEKQSLINL